MWLEFVAHIIFIGQHWPGGLIISFSLVEIVGGKNAFWDIDRVFFFLIPSYQITNSGEFVFPLDSPHKKPYECLILGRFQEKTALPLR